MLVTAAGGSHSNSVLVIPHFVTDAAFQVEVRAEAAVRLLIGCIQPVDVRSADGAATNDTEINGCERPVVVRFKHRVWKDVPAVAAHSGVKA